MEGEEVKGRDIGRHLEMDQGGETEETEGAKDGGPYLHSEVDSGVEPEN